MNKKRGTFVPETPAGTALFELGAKTEDEAWRNLLRDAAHMPYQGVEGFKKRGYKVKFWSVENEDERGVDGGRS